MGPSRMLMGKVYDEAYRQRRRSGEIGWQTADQLTECYEKLEEDFRGSWGTRFSTVLELGCGAGDVSFWLTRKGYQVVGIDVSSVAVNWAIEKAAALGLDVQFRTGSVLSLKDEVSGTFDLIFDSYCLHCITGPDRQVLLNEAYSVLNPTGLLHLRTMCADTEPELVGEIASRFDRKSRCLLSNDGTPVRYIGRPADILNEVRFAGFKVVLQYVRPRTARPNDQDELIVWAERK